MMKNEDLKNGMIVVITSDENLGAKFDKNRYVQRGDILEVTKVLGDGVFGFKTLETTVYLSEARFVEPFTGIIREVTSSDAKHLCHCDYITFSRYGCQCGGI